MTPADKFTQLINENKMLTTHEAVIPVWSRATVDDNGDEVVHPVGIHRVVRLK